MHIVHVASEFAPVAKVGGLGDVISGLSSALADLGHKITVFLPKYDSIDETSLEELHVIEESFSIEENHTAIQNRIWSASYNGLELILIDPDHPKKYFARGKIYQEPDDNDRFLYFCKAVSNYLEKKLPDVVHLHDWPSAACSLFLKGIVRTVFTIHNLQHQGRCGPFNLDRLGLDYDEEQIRDHEYNEALNLLRGAIYASTMITTVSPTYLQEILTPEQGCGLDADLKRNKKKLKGILNGLDTKYWDPNQDLQIEKKYSSESWPEGKKINKQRLKEKLGLPEGNQPLVVSVSRLVPQKGPDLIHYGALKTVELGGQFALLGSGDPEIEAEFHDLASHPNMAIRLDYDEPLAHLFYAGGDMFLMPSIYEPCGISQMIAMRYGCVPLVRTTGGLKDTVFDGKNGFTFEIPDNKGVSSVLEKGFSTFSSEEWQDLVRSGMNGDYSWDTAAKKYLGIYAG